MSDDNALTEVLNREDVESSIPEGRIHEAIETDNSGNVQANDEHQSIQSEKVPDGKSACAEDTCGVKKNKEVHIVEKLSNLHCPFVWQADLHISSYGDHDFDLLANAEEMFEETGFRFRRFVTNLVLCYHHFYERLIEDCLQNLEELERMLSHSSRRDSRDFLFNNINEALYHVIHSCRLYIMMYTDQKEQISMIFSKIEPYATMNDTNKAGIWGIRASVYVEYGYEGVVAALDYIQKAIDLDPTNAFWPFMKGTYLGRLRRKEHSLAMPTVNEVQNLEYAVKMREDPAFLAFTAEVYLEMSKTATKLYKEKFSSVARQAIKQLFTQLDLCNQKAAQYFRRSVELKPNCSHLLFRCGKGLMRLPPPYQDLEEAERYLRQGLQIAPESSFGNHAMAIFYEKYKKDFDLAEKHLAVSVVRRNFQAHMDACRIKFIETEDPEELIRDLRNMLDIYTELPSRRKLWGEIVCFYLFVDYDLVEACVHMKTLLGLRTKFSDGKKFKSGIFNFRDSLPLQDIVLSEIGYRYRQISTSQEEKNVYKKFVDFLLTENIDVPDKIPENLFSIYAAELQEGLKRLQKGGKTSRSQGTKEKVISKTYSSHKDSKAYEYYKYYGSREKPEKSMVSTLLDDNGSDNENRSRRANTLELTDVGRNKKHTRHNHSDVRKSYENKHVAEYSSTESDSSRSSDSVDKYKDEKCRHRTVTRKSGRNHDHLSTTSAEFDSTDSKRTSDDDDADYVSDQRKARKKRRDGKERRVHKNSVRKGNSVSDEIYSTEDNTSEDLIKEKKKRRDLHLLLSDACTLKEDRSSTAERTRNYRKCERVSHNSDEEYVSKEKLRSRKSHYVPSDDSEKSSHFSSTRSHGGASNSRIRKRFSAERDEKRKLPPEDEVNDSDTRANSLRQSLDVDRLREKGPRKRANESAKTNRYRDLRDSREQIRDRRNSRKNSDASSNRGRKTDRESECSDSNSGSSLSSYASSSRRSRR